MNRLSLYFCVLLLVTSCIGKENQEYKGSPVVQITFLSSTHTTASFKVESLNADGVYFLCRKPSDTLPNTDEMRILGTLSQSDTVVVDNLEGSSGYIAYAMAFLKPDTYSSIVSKEFSTGVIAGDMYDWEMNRGEVPFLADITLCPGGGALNNNPWFELPTSWDYKRFLPHTSFVDENGERKWLFDAYLAISGVDTEGNNYGINNNGRKSANKESWEAFAKYWLGFPGAFMNLDTAISDYPPDKKDNRRHYVVMMLPDPVMFERFSDKSSSTTYWGALDGRQMDFSKVEDQIAALKWYIDLCRAQFARIRWLNIELAGFYILSEELVAKPGGWNYDQKRWDRILSKIGEYLNERNEGLYWIPYRGADGTDMWRELGINQAWLQPNYYWDYNNEKPIKESFKMMKDLGMGLELEFEYSMVGSLMQTPGIMGPDGSGQYVFTSKDVPSLRARFREYMDGFKESGMYGKYSIALYSGSNAMYQLAASEDQEDKKVYLELCHFIADSPLKHK